MNLWLSTLLFALLFLSSSAQTSEECQPLVAPKSLSDPSTMYGKMIFLAGYADHAFFKSLLKITESSWTNFTESPTGKTEVVMYQRSRMNGTCIKVTTKVKIEGNTMTTTDLYGTSEFHMLPSRDDSFVFLINSTVSDFKGLLRWMKLSDANMPDKISARALYLAGRRQTVTESEMEHFKKQASCLGFSGELDFLYNPEISFCREDEGIEIPSPE